MTYKKALAYFTRRKTQLGLADTIQQAEDLAIKALEKQIPKKPLLHSFSESHDTYTYFKCPNLCDTYCEVKNNMHFCPKCGQALDWSGTK